MRNRQIVSDVEECLKQGRTPLVLTKFKDHADTLLVMLQDKADHVFLLKGGRGRKENDSYMSVFERDTAEADVEIVISSPGVGARSIRRLLKDLGERHVSGVKITLLTLLTDGYPKEYIEKTKELLASLRSSWQRRLESADKNMPVLRKE